MGSSGIVQSLAVNCVDNCLPLLLVILGQVCLIVLAASFPSPGIQSLLSPILPVTSYYKLQAAQSKEKAIVTFAQVAEAWEREHREQIEIRTWKNYAPHYQSLLRQFGQLPFSQVTALDVSSDLMKAKAAKYSATVIKTRRSLYNMIFDYAVIHGYAKYNPIGSVKLPKGLKQGKRKAPTHEQMLTILNGLEAPFGLFPYLLLCTGLRKSEALALQWKDVDIRYGYTHVNGRGRADGTENSWTRQSRDYPGNLYRPSHPPENKIC